MPTTSTETARQSRGEAAVEAGFAGASQACAHVDGGPESGPQAPQGAGSGPRQRPPRNANGYTNPPGPADGPGEPSTHETYWLHRNARKLLKDKRVSYCLRVPRHDRVDIIAHHHDDGCRCSFQGVTRCADVWCCPVCGQMISRQRAREVDAACSAWIAEGGRIAMLTLTMPHTDTDHLPQLLDWLGQGLQRTKRGNPWKRIAARHGIQGTITTKETTWGREAGWHPHFHLVLFVSGDAEAEALEADIAPRWRTMIGKVCGREPNEHGCRVTVRGDAEASAAAAAYLTKGAWSIGRELEGTHSKEAKAGRFTPLDLLRRYGAAVEEGDDAGQSRWGGLFREYVDAYRRRQQTQWSPGLKDRFGVRDLDEQEAAEGKGEPEKSTIASIGRRAWDVVFNNNYQGVVCRIAEKEGYEGVRAFFARFGLDVGLTDPPMFEALGGMAGPSPPVMDYGDAIAGGKP